MGNNTVILGTTPTDLEIPFNVGFGWSAFLIVVGTGLAGTTGRLLLDGTEVDTSVFANGGFTFQLTDTQVANLNPPDEGGTVGTAQVVVDGGGGLIELFSDGLYYRR